MISSLLVSRVVLDCAADVNVGLGRVWRLRRPARHTVVLVRVVRVRKEVVAVVGPVPRLLKVAVVCRGSQRREETRGPRVRLHAGMRMTTLLTYMRTDGLL